MKTAVLTVLLSATATAAASPADCTCGSLPGAPCPGGSSADPTRSMCRQLAYPLTMHLD